MVVAERRAAVAAFGEGDQVTAVRRLDDGRDAVTVVAFGLLLEDEGAGDVGGRGGTADGGGHGNGGAPRQRGQQSPGETGDVHGETPCGFDFVVAAESPVDPYKSRTTPYNAL